MQFVVHPAPCFYGIEARDDYVELSDKIVLERGEVLVMAHDMDWSRQFVLVAEVVDGGSGDVGLWFADICVCEEELAVQVGQLDGVHVYDVEERYAKEGQSLYDFAPEPAGS